MFMLGDAAIEGGRAGVTAPDCTHEAARKERLTANCFAATSLAFMRAHLAPAPRQWDGTCDSCMYVSIITHRVQPNEVFMQHKRTSFVFHMMERFLHCRQVLALQ